MAPRELAAVPHSDHAADVLWGSLGAQITRYVLAEFLKQHLPATEFH
jgi:hypothetical protein